MATVNSPSIKNLLSTQQQGWKQLNENNVTYFGYVAICLAAIIGTLVIGIIVTLSLRKLLRRVMPKHAEQDRRYRIEKYAYDVLRRKKRVKAFKNLFRRRESSERNSTSIQLPEKPKRSRFSLALSCLFYTENVLVYLLIFVVIGIIIALCSFYSREFGYAGLVLSLLGSICCMWLTSLHVFRERDMTSLVHHLESKPVSIEMNLPKRVSEEGDEESDDAARFEQLQLKGRNEEEEAASVQTPPSIVVALDSPLGENTLDQSYPHSQSDNKFRDALLGLSNLIVARKDKKRRLEVTKHGVNKFLTRLYFWTLDQLDIHLFGIKYGILRHPFKFWLTVSGSLAVNILLYVLLFGTCLCVQPFATSSAATRASEAFGCPKNTICQSLVLGTHGSMANSMIIKFQTNDRPISSDLLFGTSSLLSNSSSKVSCSIYDISAYMMNFAGGETSRFIHTCHLADLQPATRYFFKPIVLTRDGAINSTVRSFQTLGNDPAKPVKILAGGDIGFYQQGSVDMMHLAAQLEPDVIAIGGDISYANGLVPCYKRWDDVLQMMSQYFVTKQGDMIPIITSTGNHEARFNLFSSNVPDAFHYLALFSHRSDLTSEQLIDSNVGVMHTHTMSNGATALVVVDSGVIRPYESQNQWLESELSRLKNNGAKNILLMYHAPLYPSSRSFTGHTAVEGRAQWGPIFDKYNVSVAFEHHDHTFKRTKPIRGGKIVANNQGTVYVGDGCAGVSIRTVTTDPVALQYMEKTGSIRHWWLAECAASDGCVVSAIDETGTKVDQFSVSPIN